MLAAVGTMLQSQKTQTCTFCVQIHARLHPARTHVMFLNCYAQDSCGSGLREMHTHTAQTTHTHTHKHDALEWFLYFCFTSLDNFVFLKHPLLGSNTDILFLALCWWIPSLPFQSRLFLVCGFYVRNTVATTNVMHTSPHKAGRRNQTNGSHGSPYRTPVCESKCFCVREFDNL